MLHTWIYWRFDKNLSNDINSKYAKGITKTKNITLILILPFLPDHIYVYKYVLLQYNYSY